MSHGKTGGLSAGLVVGALGVVFGDVGTSPLYALRTVFADSHLDPADLGNILGVLSLIFWSILLIVAVKYVLIVLKADNEGEGGVLALTQLTVHSADRRLIAVLSFIGLAGCSLFFGDGVITPAISVLSAVEGLEIVAPDLEHAVIPIAAVVLLGLFSVQKRGTDTIGKAFGPIMIIWFTTLAVLGVRSIVQNPEVLVAVNPLYAISLVQTHFVLSLTIFGAVFLCVTGGEALYADLGHFGRPAISWAWFIGVLPALLLNYFGQGALLLREPDALKNPFYLLAPQEVILPLVLLSTAATVIASQAVISGVFSICRQCQLLGYLPRMRIVHSSESSIGQVYLPSVNWALCICTLILVAGFQSSDALAGAYGIGVSITMVIDSVLMLSLLWTMRKGVNVAQMVVLGLVLIIELLFVLGNSAKITSGGWFPLIFGLALLTAMRTWQRGRSELAKRTSREDYTPHKFQELLESTRPVTVPRTAVFLSSDRTLLPRTLVRNVKYNGVIHAQTVVLNLQTAPVPRVLRGSTTRSEMLMPGLYRIWAQVGFMETPDVPKLLRDAQRTWKDLDLHDVTYFLGRDDIVLTNQGNLPLWRKRLFAFMSRNSAFAGTHFGLEASKVVESGAQVEL
ncbi:MAG: potassium transporter Kup [Gammaproteobacteria bacterium]|jgi:KUP system potassium uptake protein|nr:potassium transporter Kup [Gammaproteobacteria bacterium]